MMHCVALMLIVLMYIRNDLNKFYDNITESTSKASEAIFDNKCAGTNRRNGTHSVPGWNEHVNELLNILLDSPFWNG